MMSELEGMGVREAEELMSELEEKGLREEVVSAWAISCPFEGEIEISIEMMA